MYFPDHFKESDNDNYNILFLRLLEKRVDNFINPSEENDVDIYDIELQLLELRKPRTWNVYAPGNMEIEMEVEFEKLLIAISENSNESPDDLTVFRFYAKIDYLKELAIKNAKK